MLMRTNSGCTLPCLWSSQPGETTLEEIRAFASNLDREVIGSQLNEQPFVRSDGLSIYDFWLFFNPVGSLRVDFIVEDELLAWTHVVINKANDWLPDSVFELPDLLGELGSPTDVFVLVAGRPLRFSLTLVYNDKGIMVRYGVYFSKDEIIRESEPLQICPLKEQTYRIEAWLQSSDYETIVEEQFPGLREDRSQRPDLPLEVVAEMDVETFTQLFTDNPDSCIEMLSLRDLREQGYEY
jgi:hypothetical protein